MERKWTSWSIVKRLSLSGIVLLTLCSCIRNSGQAGHIPDKPIQFTPQHIEVIGILYKQWRRQRCLSAIIKQASDTNVCFDCHDKIER